MKYDELYHHGILGMKWGIRRYQNKDGTLTEAGKKRYFDSDDKTDSKSDRVSKKYDKKIAKNDKERTSILNAREKNRSRIESKYDKKIAKTNNDKKSALEEEKKAKLSDFDEGTKFVKAGYDRYENVIKNYRDAKIKSLSSKDYKSTASYKLIRNQYADQKVSDLFSYGGKSFTTLNYAYKYANMNDKDRERFVRGGVSKRGTY